MSDFDHGDLLQSLSINDNDRNNNELRNRYHNNNFSEIPTIIDDTMNDYDILDDPMDIDDDLQNVIEDFEIDELPKNNEKDNESEEETSFLNLLSPTMLGAKLAIKKPLLLMPPPPSFKEQAERLHSPCSSTENLRKSSIDYEYDLSSFTPIANGKNQVSKRDNSSFYSSNLNSFIPSLKSDSIYKQPEDDSEDFNVNQMSYSNYHQHFAFNPYSHQPIMVQHHHHHYYNNNSDSKINNSDSIDKETDQFSSLIEQKNKEVEFYKQNIHSSINYENELSKLKNLKHGQLINLPVPWKAGISPIERIPYMLSSYLQLMLNIIATLYFIYIIYYFISSINKDIVYKINLQKKSLRASIEQARRAFYENGCDTQDENLVPLLVSKCRSFESIMNQDPNDIGNISSISVGLIGLLINSLIEPLSLKVYMFMTLFIVTIFGCNFTFGYIRAKTYYGDSNVQQKSSKKN